MRMSEIRPPERYGKATVRQNHSYRAARREEQKMIYRKRKRKRS